MTLSAAALYNVELQDDRSVMNRKSLEGNGHRLISDAIPEFSWRD
jgi:hypothetical protein